MRVTTFSPSAALAPYVARFAIVETGALEETRALLPELGLVAGVRFAGAAHVRGTRMPEATLTGLHASVREMTTLPHSGVILAQFVPGGAASFFPRPLHELVGKTIATDLDPRDMRAACDHATRVQIFEELLRARLCDRRDPLVETAVAAIITARGDLRIAALAQQLATAQDPLEKRFRRVVGASPKHVATIVRIKHAIALGRQATWSQAAHAAGYFDQAHFNRDFRAVTGASPSVFFRDTAYC